MSGVCTNSGDLWGAGAGALQPREKGKTMTYTTEEFDLIEDVSPDIGLPPMPELEDKTEVFRDGVWVVAEPLPGDKVRQTYSSGHVAEYLYREPVEPVLMEISITKVTGAVKTSSDYTRITCLELTDIVVTGTVAVPDQTFSMPLKRDDGRLTLFPAQVVNGQFEVVLNFPTSGQFVYTNEQANHDLPELMFKVAPIRVDVLRKAAV
ncbi:hypothetical protein AB1J03_16060 [Vibrio diabolicus]|uniref:hypothetical protein n=1 Tax=Vibrio diabolicus TaxID=50719 RepID=UPI003459F0C8